MNRQTNHIREITSTQGIFLAIIVAQRRQNEKTPKMAPKTTPFLPFNKGVTQNGVHFRNQREKLPLYCATNTRKNNYIKICRGSLSKMTKSAISRIIKDQECQSKLA